MLLFTLCALLAAQGVEVDGLAPGERFDWLAPAVAGDSAVERWQEGRVLDARTGLPLGGAVLEAWTEKISKEGPGFRRVGETTTGADGLFRLRVQEGSLRGDKVRVRAVGYLTRSATESDLSDPVLLMPAPAVPMRIRITDLLDRPVPDARITSTESCSHDLPAFEARTDAFGVALLPDWGLQACMPELRVRAAGYTAIESVDGSEVLLDAQALAEGAIPTLRLAQKPALRAKLVPATTAPILIVDGEGQHVLFPDAEGRFEVLSLYGAGEVVITRLADGQLIHHGRVPAGREVALRSGAASEPPQAASVELEIEPALADTKLPVALFHPDGWTLSADVATSPARLEFSAGEGISLWIGGAFSGFEEEFRELDLVAGETTKVHISVRREPELTVLTPVGESGQALIEVGGDSLAVELDPAGTTHLRVPGGRPVVILQVGVRTRRLALPSLVGDATADLRSDACLLPVCGELLLQQRPRTALEVSVKTTASAPVGELTVRGPGEPIVSALGSGLWRVEGPAGAPLLLHYRVAGHADLWAQAAAPLPNTSAERIVLAPPPLAALRIHGLGAGTIEGPLADTLDALHPGPLTLVLRLQNGRRLALSLHLQPGEQRTLRILAH
jgi:hypothetical protein